MRDESVDGILSTVSIYLSLFIYISRLMRDESVDGTLSPVSNKGTSEDETDNTTARRKVKIYFYMQIASERNRSLFGKGAFLPP